MSSLHKKMTLFWFLRFGAIALFLCWSTAHSATTVIKEEKHQTEDVEIRNILEHLVMRERDERDKIESLETVMTKSDPTVNSSLTNIRVRKGYEYDGKPMVPEDVIKEAVRRASLLDDKEYFQPLIPYHSQLAEPLYDVLFRVDRSQLGSVLGTIKQFMNKYLFNNVLRLVMRHRSDIFENDDTPSHITLVPYMYFEMGDLGLEKLDRNAESRFILTGKFTHDPDSRDIDHRLEYFRQDPGLNTFHGHWHECILNSREYESDKWWVNRSGELFYYAHSQIVARYNFERLSLQLPLVKPLDNFHERVPEPYFEKLTTKSRAKLWDSRPPNSEMKDVERDGYSVTIQGMDRMRERIYETVDHGFVHIAGKSVAEMFEPLNGPYNASNQSAGVPFDIGIDKLGFIVWGNRKKSVNYRYYDNLHVAGHTVLAYSHDPNGLYYEQSRGGTMANNYASPRDPTFYTWHTFIDEIFQRYKSTLPAYAKEELEFENVVIQEVEVKSGNDTNIFNTMWVKDTVNITEGISVNMKKMLGVKTVYYDFVHLGHKDFEFHIKVENNNGKKVKGTVRIFLAPEYKDWHLEPAFNKYRKLFIELDKFVHVLEPGKQTIVRGSNSSSVTIPYKQLFRTKEDVLMLKKSVSSEEYLSWAGCGWPDYLQIPKGTEEGFGARLFVMISNFTKDRSSDKIKDFGSSAKGSSYCGRPNEMNPDGKPMGYPFDRDYGDQNTYLQDFITRKEDLSGRITNMEAISVTIKHLPSNPETGQSIIDRDNIDPTHHGLVLGTMKQFTNESPFNNVLQLEFRHRSDIFKDDDPPLYITLAPYMYFEMGDLDLEKLDHKEESRLILTGKFTHDPDSRDIDHRLEYFRLDPGLNSFHAHWHECMPDPRGYESEKWWVNRSGEIFYYAHSQMVARYNFERLSLKLPLVKPLDNFHERVPEAYFEKLTTETRAKLWDSWPPNSEMKDVDRDGYSVTIQGMDRMRERIYEAIDHGFIHLAGNSPAEMFEPLNGPYNASNQSAGVPFDVGIDKLGFIVWGNRKKSVNYRYYNNLHAGGHIALAFSHDPDGLYYEQSRVGAMANTRTALRDPAFFRWHTFMDNIFQRYKSTLPAYTIEELEFENVVIHKVEVKSGNDTNIFNTMWVKDTVNITEGISVNTTEMLGVKSVYYDFVHLGHKDFEFQIKVTNNNRKNLMGTVRIFLAPQYVDWNYLKTYRSLSEDQQEEVLERNPYLEPAFNKYRKLFIELDKFVHVLLPGEQTIVRGSNSSSVTIPYKQLFKTEEEAFAENSESPKDYLAWSGCGWPDYLQIPKGTEEGFGARLFVMISNFTKDRFSDKIKDFGNSTKGSLSYCGRPNEPNPDGKPMGYPFDRDYGDSNTYLQDFITRREDVSDRITNMVAINVTIKHHPNTRELKIGQSINDRDNRKD